LAADVPRVERWAKKAAGKDATRFGVLLRIAALTATITLLAGILRMLSWDLREDHLPSSPKKSEPATPAIAVGDGAKPGAAPQNPAKGDFMNTIGIKMKLIQPGTFEMGSPRSESDRSDDETRHDVEITRPFYLGVYEVTQGEFHAVMGRNPSWFAANGDRCPVERVSWYDAVEFCNTLSEQEDFPPYYSITDPIRGPSGILARATVQVWGGTGYRLPTEAEWEYACRAGTTTPFHFGYALNGREANVDGNFPYGVVEKGPYRQVTTIVGSYHPNAFGLYDMHGNVWEWCWDWYDELYFRNSPLSDPQGPPDGVSRVMRGGSWDHEAGFARAADRSEREPTEDRSVFGFRIAKDSQ
jgi:formylglycine-generating enzyme required for sulfatase activity